jgi:hypothetical protein
VAGDTYKKVTSGKNIIFHDGYFLICESILC